MNGNEVYVNNFQNKINKLIETNPDKNYLKGFVNFINNSDSTTYNYLFYVISFMNYAKKNVKDLELDDYTEYLSTLKDKTPAYNIAVYAGLKKFSLYLEASNKNILNPMQYVTRPKFSENERTKQKREVGYLEVKEIKKLINTIDKGCGSQKAMAHQMNWKSRDRLIIMIFLNTGIRCSALYKLNVDSIDLNKKTLITIDKGNKYREFDLSDELIEYVKLWLNDRNTLLKGISEDALFISSRRTRMDQSSIARIVKKYAADIEGKNITPHKLRATYGTQLYSKTKDLYMVQECMGHSNPKTTELYIRGQKSGATKTASDIMSKILYT